MNPLGAWALAQEHIGDIRRDSRRGPGRRRRVPASWRVRLGWVVVEAGLHLVSTATVGDTAAFPA